VISFGVDGESGQSMDPPDHQLRIRLVASLLDVCGEYFKTGSSKKKLDCFLVFFSRYYWRKRTQWQAWSQGSMPFPVEVQYCYEELMDSLRPRDSRPRSLEEADRAMANLEAQYRDQVDSALRHFENGGDEASPSGGEEEEADDERAPMKDNIALGRIAEEEEASDDSMSPLDEEMDDDAIHIHMKQRSIQAEDEQFVKDLDRLLAESMQIRSQPSSGSMAIADLVVPTAARAKFNRNINFEDATGMKKTPSDESSSRMALLTRGKGSRPVLRQVALDVPTGLAEQWKEQKARDQDERRQLKSLVLNLNQRMEADEQ